MALAADVLVPLAEVARPHGVRGEVRLKLFNHDSDLLLDRDEVVLRLLDGSEHEVSVDSARRAVDAVLMKLHSVDDRDRADDLRGALVCVRRGDFPSLEEGEFYACDVEGLPVRVRAVSGELSDLGTVTELVIYPSVECLAVKTSSGPIEVPLVEHFVEVVDVPGGQVVLRTTEGLLGRP